MYKALEMLGYECWHGIQFINNIADVPMWIEALDAKFNIGNTPQPHESPKPPFTRTEWDQLFSHHSAVSSDSPAIAFAEDLIKAYPEAKVILYEREIDSWFRSYNKAIIESMFSPLLNFIADIDPTYVGMIRKVHVGSARALLGVTMTSKQEMRDAAKPAYRAHYDLVRRVTPPERLLEYKIEQGWAPLCEFLGKPIPKDEVTGEELPFPRVNDEKALKALLGTVVVQGFKNLCWRVAKWVLPLAVVGVGLGGYYWCW